MTEESVFLEALEKKPADRIAYLNSACGPDKALRRAVEELLAAHEQKSLLDRKPLSPADAPTLADDALRVGTRIGPYTLLQPLGEGGMGSVWVAQQTEPVKRKVALKLIKAGMDSKSVVARFEHERQALALMDHPNIARVFDGGVTADGRPFFVMELVNGLPLTKFCDEAKLTPRQRLELFVPICLAVQHAHQKAIVHRDLKPSNLLVTLYDGRPVPKVIDFGVAKALAGKLTDETLPTLFGAAVGTLDYMAPEQAGFSALDVDTRADIYSLGVLLYELLTGLKPIDGKRLRQAALVEVIRILQEEEPPRPSTRISTAESSPSLAAVRQMEPRRLTELLRGELDWIVMKCLEKSRERRYETANALARDIQSYLADETVTARPPSFAYRAGKVFRRNKGKVIAAAVVALALVGGIIGTSLAMLEAMHQAGIAKQVSDENHKAQVKAEAATQDALAKLWGSHLSEANARRYSGRPGQRFESLKAIQAALKLPLPEGRSRDELRNLAVAALALPDLRMPDKIWDGWPDGSFGLAFDPVALKRYARGDLKGNISVRRLEDDAEVARLPGNGEPREIVFGADGETLLLIDPKSGTVNRWKIGGVATEKIGTISNGSDIGRCEQSRDGRRLLVLHEMPMTIRAEVFDLQMGRVCFDHSLPIERTNRWYSRSRTSMSPDGRWLARAAGTDGSAQCKDVLLFDLDTGEAAGKLPNDDYIFAPTWHPDCRTLAAGGWDSNEIYVWDVPSRTRLRTLGHQKGGMPYLGIGSSGQLLTSISGWAGGQVFWHPHTGKPLLRTERAWKNVFVKAMDGRLYDREIEKNKIIVSSAEPSPILRVLVPSPATAPGECRAVAIHPNGRLLAVGHAHGVALFDLATGTEVGQLPLGANLFARFDPSSGDLLTYGPKGLYRWPVWFSPDSTETKVGPPRLLGPGSKSTDAEFDVSNDGKTIVVANYSEAIVYREEPHGVRTLRLAPLTNTRKIRITSDARWVITKPHTQGVSWVWDAHTGEKLRKLPYGEIVPFSDWMLAGRERWNIATGEQGASLPVAEGPSPFEFSPDGTVFTAMPNDEAVHLIDAKSGRTLVQLGLPEQSRTWYASFSRDGSRYVHHSADHHYVYAWDLRALRQHLAEMGLDWDGPPNFAEEQTRFARLPYSVRVDAGVLADDAKK